MTIPIAPERVPPKVSFEARDMMMAVVQKDETNVEGFHIWLDANDALRAWQSLIASTSIDLRHTAVSLDSRHTAHHGKSV
jgi:hypothetical protein